MQKSENTASPTQPTIPGFITWGVFRPADIGEVLRSSPATYSVISLSADQIQKDWDNLGYVEATIVSDAFVVMASEPIPESIEPLRIPLDRLGGYLLNHPVT